MLKILPCSQGCLLASPHSANPHADHRPAPHPEGKLACAPAPPPERLLWNPIFLLGLALRLSVLALTWLHATPGWFFGQASELGRLAESICAGHGFSSPFPGLTGPTAFLSPGYPALVAAVFALFHPYSMASAVALTIVQSFFGAATVLPLMFLARRAFGLRTANMAGAFWSCSPPLLWLPTIFWETSLSILLAATMLALAARCGKAPAKLVWLTMAATAALSLCVNPSLLTIIVCCFGWAVWQGKTRIASSPVLGIGLFLLLSLIWPMRNLRQLHAWIPLRSNMGYELWQGNRPGADGLFDPSLHPNVNAAEAHRWSSLGELSYMREKSELAKRAIAAQPVRFLKLTLKRFVYFWTGWGRNNSTLALLHILLTTVLGTAGAALAWRKKRAEAVLLLLPLLLFPLPYYITHPDVRFRLVVDPILVILAAYRVSEWRFRLRTPQPHIP